MALATATDRDTTAAAPRSLQTLKHEILVEHLALLELVNTEDFLVSSLQFVVVGLPPLQKGPAERG